MKALFNLVSGLLGLSGILHLVKVFAYPIDAGALLPVIVTALFGLAYLVIGYLLFRRGERLLWAGLVVPLLGLLLTLVGMKPNPDFYVIAFIVLDVLVVAACSYLLVQGRAGLHRRG
jgi:hypothetical protein